MVLRKLRSFKQASLRNTSTIHKTFLLLLLGLTISTNTFADEPQNLILTASSAATIHKIIASGDLGGWTFVGLQTSNDQVTASFERGRHKASVLISPPTQEASLFTLDIESKDISHTESTALVNQIFDLLTSNQPKSGFWTKPQTVKEDLWTMAQKDGSLKTWEGIPKASQMTDRFEPAVLPISATSYSSLVMLLALILSVAASLKLWRRNKQLLSISKTDLIWILIATVTAFILRTVGESIVPGWINGHGHRYINSILFAPPSGADLHGNGPWAFYIPLLQIFPRTLTTVLTIQAVVSTLTVPAIFFMTKAFVPSSSTARWTMILAALLPGFVYFGHSEERMVIGIFFLILAPLFAALASKYKSHLAIFASAALAATSAHFQPFMLFSPLTIFAVLISRSDGRSYLKTPWPWVGLWFYLLLVLEPTLQAVNNIVYGIGPANNWFSQIFALKPDMLFHMTPNLDTVSNAYFATELTPYVFRFLLMLGFVSLHFKKRTIPAAWALLLSALIYVLLSGGAGRMDAIRLQLPAQPWFLALSGAGLTAISSLARKYIPKVPKPLRNGIILALLIGIIALDPGPMFKTFGPQKETKVLVQGIEQVPEGCVLIWPAMSKKSGVGVPTWATMERHKLVHWYALKDFEELRRPFPPCLYYLRPLACHDRNNPVESDNGDGMRSECVFIERQLGRMSPVHVKTIVAEPDCMQNYRPGPVEVGIWKVNTDPQP